jgi:hypothetical protein
MKSCLRLLCFGAALAGATPGLTREPTQLEQYYLELVNRARANPNGEVTRLSAEVWGDEGSPAVADLNEGLAPGTLNGDARQPLAFDTRLIDSASDYSDFLLATEQFSHTANGTASSRMTTAGYTFTPPSIAGENLAITASSGPHPVDKTRVDKHHEGLFIDGDVAGRGHRINLLLADFREAGIAIRADADGDSFFTGPLNDVLSTQNFAKSAGRIFVTGVIHYDTNTNNFFDPGESAGVLALTVKTMGGATVASGTSFGSGGYSINLNGVAAGTYRLVVRDSMNFEDSVSFSWTGTENVKVDIRDPALFATPVLGNPFQPDGRIGLTATSFTGNDVYSDLPLGQNLTRTARSRSSLSWHARIENDGIQADSLSVTGSRSSRLFKVTYLQQEGAAFVNATAQLATGRTGSFQSGAETSYRIIVTPGRSASGKRSGYQFQLRGVSNNDGTKVDRVNGQVVNRIR